MTKQKPRLSSRGIVALMAMHDGQSTGIPVEARSELMSQNLCCYSEGWKLTKLGKTIARHLAGRI